MSEKKDLAKIGEFGLIRLLTENISLKNKTTLTGVGDDAAILNLKDGQTVVTTDILTEGIHFDLIYTPLKHLGYKAVIVNLSDIYAMNAYPEQILVSIAISAKFTTDMLEELYDGIKLACDIYNVDLVGGDTTSSLTGLTISITAIGRTEKERITCRSGAKENHLICVSGDLGGAFIGLQLLEREKKVFENNNNVQPDFTGAEYVLERQLKPEARKDIIDILTDKEIVPSAMIDLSDGLSSDILHICQMSNCGCRIYAEKIPVARETRKIAEELGLEPVTMALNGGEDYELLFTIPLDDFEKVKQIDQISIIGHITKKSEGNYLVASDNSVMEIVALGWDSLLKD